MLYSRDRTISCSVLEHGHYCDTNEHCNIGRAQVLFHPLVIVNFSMCVTLESWSVMLMHDAGHPVYECQPGLSRFISFLMQLYFLHYASISIGNSYFIISNNNAYFNK